MNISLHFSGINILCLSLHLLPTGEPNVSTRPRDLLSSLLLDGASTIHASSATANTRVPTALNYINTVEFYSQIPTNQAPFKCEFPLFPII